MEYPWYQAIHNTNELQQGDFIPDCPIVVPPNTIKEDEETEIEIRQIDSVILSQSCDLANDKVEIVLVCPFYPLNTFIESLPEEQTRNNKAKDKIKQNLKKGFLPGYHLLSKEHDFFDDHQVVDFRNVYGIQKETLCNLSLKLGQRIRLLPPYREHLSQAFARYFMRVGLPQDIIV
ncbi:hypothetical protein [Marinilabilia sp.]|uniref:hypothetical protein n=1 Tax=Marinilabilia sp. TaxID=2021252 RepID=UPI0025BD7F8F|nr:hypothetical protein [Marinilabilia sp.]